MIDYGCPRARRQSTSLVARGELPDAATLYVYSRSVALDGAVRRPRGAGAYAWRRVQGTDWRLKRVGDPDEIAGLVAYVASGESGYMTGSSLTIDGGMAL